MSATRWWEIVEIPAEVNDIDYLSGTFTITDATGVYIVDLLTDEVQDGPL